MIRTGLEALLTGCDRYRAAVDLVRSITVDSPGFDGRDYGYDGRVEEWALFARGVLDGDIGKPGLSPLGDWKVNDRV